MCAGKILYLCIRMSGKEPHTGLSSEKKRTNLHQHICAHHPLPRTVLFLNRTQSRERTLAQPTDCTEGKTSCKTNSFLEGINSSSLKWHRYLISKQAHYLGQFRNKPRFLSSLLRNHFGQLWDTALRVGCGLT